MFLKRARPLVTAPAQLLKVEPEFRDLARHPGATVLGVARTGLKG
ncbi:hypothetical protein [Streptomyces sp. NPDC004284]